MPLSSLKKAYDDTLLDNTSTLVQVETALRNVTWFLPGRFQDAEVASEGGEWVYSALSLVSLYHDSILSKRLEQLRRLPSSAFAQPSGARAEVPGTSHTVESTSISSETREGEDGGIPRPSSLDTKSDFPPNPLADGPAPFPEQIPDDTAEALRAALPLPSEHARYTQHFARNSATYRTASRALVVIGYREVDPSVIAQASATSEHDPSSIPSSDARHDNNDDGSRSPLRATMPSAVPRIVSSFPVGSPAHQQLTPLLSRLPETYQPNPADLLPRLEGVREWLGEGMVATEGLIGVLGALWQRYTRTKVMRFVGLLERIWGVRLVAGILMDHVELVDEYYYYTSS
ncbi:hypothetical protein QFC19_003916 [Naganishia cerealis]|uniref:Uncharacterized protein n=1 Tax=Naganishia cerealis TaxID=610337 RepID=A0ACC2W0Y1_9TREE|nr:hypothetical protein QFC19_003916 [Naganishia cerealis]